MTSDPEPRGGTATPTAGRPIVLEPMPPGWWLVIGGVVLAALAPLFGFLVGSMIGEGDGDGLSPIYLFLLLGFLVGGVGILVALWGAYTIIDRRREAGRTAIDLDVDERPADAGPPADDASAVDDPRGS
jgi:hypothetical protein